VNVSRGGISDQQLQRWVDESALIFRGKMIKPGSNVNSIDMKDAPMIVRVERVESSNQGALQKFGSLVDKELTVIADPLSRIQAPKENVSVVFFVNPLLYEKNIAVMANGIADDRAELKFSERLSEAVQRKSEKPLKDAVESADGIIAGTVKEIRSLPQAKLAQLRSFADGRDIFSEHSPRWKEALIVVESVLKGDSAMTMALVVFPSSDDRMWADSPKLEKDQTGIWLLHGNETTKAESGILLAPEKFDGQAIKAYTTLNPEDFQPKDPDGKNEARIREILKALKP
jgi:hypothetical protein